MKRDLELVDAYPRLKALLEHLAVADADGVLHIADRPSFADLDRRCNCARGVTRRLMQVLTAGGYVSERGRGLVLRRRLPIAF